VGKLIPALDTPWLLWHDPPEAVGGELGETLGFRHWALDLETQNQAPGTRNPAPGTKNQKPGTRKGGKNEAGVVKCKVKL